MFIDFFLETFRDNADKPAIIWRKKVYPYSWLAKRVAAWQRRLKANGVTAGAVVGLEGDFSPGPIALLFALIERGAVVVPHNRDSKTDKALKFKISQVGRSYRFDRSDKVTSTVFAHRARHPLYRELRRRKHPGLVLFTSGSSGEPKAVVHDFTGLLEKFKTPRAALKTLNFLVFDHWGGLNTMFHTLSNAGAVIPVSGRSPDQVCAAIAAHAIEVLPCSPTFLNLLLLSGAHRRHDLSSLKVITYGTEPMPEATLKRLRAEFPTVRLAQTYGLIELGVLRSKSKSQDSLWVKVGGEGYETRVVDGILQIKARSAMLGYLNAPSPFTKDGYFITGDSVEVDGEYLRILGRKSELINVGGEKVYPAEVENAIQELDNVAEAVVYGEKNPLTGAIVCAKVRLVRPEDPAAFVARLKQFCRKRLPSYKVPVKVALVTESQATERFKKTRR